MPTLKYTFTEYCHLKGITERAAYLQIRAGKILSFKEDGERIIVENKPALFTDSKTMRLILDAKKKEFRERVMSIAVQIKTMGRSAETEARVQEILDEISELDKTGLRVKGFQIRNIQLQIKKYLNGTPLERRTRADKFSARNRVMKENPAAFGKAMELISQFYLQDPLHSLAQAIDMARYYAKNNEDYYEVVAINIHTLKRHINRAFSASGMKTLNEFMNHYNQFKKRLPYVEGAFTADTGFFDVFSLDDHKMDVAGALQFNPTTGKFEQKLIYSWVVVEMKSMMPLAWQIQADPFKDEDIVRLLMRTFKQWGLPKQKVICDQGLAASQYVKDFMNRLGCVLDAQPPYTPTAKANNERFFKFVKNECDVYVNNFVGANHPVEGRHTGQRLSPEATTELISESVKRYETYFTGFCIERPRERNIPGIEHLLDNTKRVTIKDLFDYYYLTHQKNEVSHEQLKYAYMKYETTTKFEKSYLMFKGSLYMPMPDARGNYSLAVNDEKNRYWVGYDPEDLNKIELYAAQDIIDMLTGDLIMKGQKVCTMESIRHLSPEERKQKVRRHKKAVLEMVRSLRDRFAKKDIVNDVITGDGTLKSIQKEQEKEIKRILEETIPMDRIELAVNDVEEKPKINIDEALSDESFASLDNIKVD